MKSVIIALLLIYVTVTGAAAAIHMAGSIAQAQTAQAQALESLEVR